MSPAPVVVVGGGPAGAATALALARHGVGAVVLEAAADPQAKVGEDLPPGTNAVLDRLGLGEVVRRAGLPSHGTRSVWGSAQETVRDFVFGPAGDGWRLDRQAFEAGLAAAATRAGVAWRSGHRLVGLARRGRGWDLRVATPAGTRHEVAEVVVDASGRAARVARALGARRVRRDRLVAAVGYLPVDADPAGPAADTTLLVEAEPGGWWYSLVLPGGRMVLARLTDADLLDRPALRRPAGLTGLLAAAPATRARWAAVRTGDALDGPHLRPADTSRLTAVTGPGWVAVGDAAVTFDPLASYGIEAALGAGCYAAAAVAEHLGGRSDALPAYADLVDRTVAAYLVMQHDRYVAERRWPDAPFWRRRHRPRTPAGRG